MGILGGNKQFDPDKEKCELDRDNMQFQCQFADEKGGEDRRGAVVVQVDENGEIVGSQHELEGFSQEEKQRLQQITGSQLKGEIDKGPLDGYSDGGSL